MGFRDDVTLAHMALNEDGRTEALEILGDSLRRHPVQFRAMVITQLVLAGPQAARDLISIKNGRTYPEEKE